MNFLSPEFLWLLLAVPALVGAYVLLIRRSRHALRYASLSLIKDAMSPGRQFRRHIPPLLVLSALVVLIVAVARPTASVTLPFETRTIVLAMDVSLSMRATDVEPNRMAADHGVRVFTVGFGSAAGGAVDIYGMSIYMRFDEETLKAIAETTRAEYFHAASAADLKKVYENLNSRFALEKTETEITALLAVAAAIMVVAAAILSLLWSNRLG